VADIFNHYANFIATMICMVMLGAIYFANKYKINLWWLGFWYSFPVIGKIARISKDSTRYAKDKAWTNSERTLCEDYNQYLKYVSETELRKRLVYLSKAGDLGRTSLPVWLVMVLGILVVAEGMGFSYMLGTWMAGEGGSENTRTLLMYAIVLVLCVILIFVTHSAGHQLYRTNLVKQCEREWREAGQEGPFRSANIMLEGDQTVDDNAPHYTQCANRVGTSGSYVMVILAGVVIAAIAIASTWMRVKHLESEMVSETTQSVAAATQGGNPFAGGNLPLPDEVTKPQADAEKKGAEDGSSAHKGEGLAAFIMLAFIFIVTQIVGIAAGFKWGFAGRESKAAYAGTHGFSTYDDYTAYYAPVIRTAQAKLQGLQQRLKGVNVGLDLKKSFDDFLDELRRPKGPSVYAAVTQPPGQAQEPEAISTVDQALQKIDGFGENKDAAKAYIASLPASLKDAVVTVLKERKAKKDAERQEAALREQNRELDELL